MTKYVINVLKNLFDMIFKQSLSNVCTRWLSGSVTTSKLVLGCGSNVVDQFFMVQGI